jgi:hypothetical protein
VELVPAQETQESELERMIVAAHWADPLRHRDVICGRQGRTVRDAEGRPSAERVGLLPWSNAWFSVAVGQSAQGPVRTTESGVEPWAWLSPGNLAGWIIGRYLDAVRGRPFPIWIDDADAADSVWPILSRLASRAERVLPSEYEGRLDEVSPTSMGSATLRYDDEGRVPWDKIWTSFCDLAMAGGPPHRGTLLEALTPEQAMADPVRYASVVSELRRGIELASGLATLESATPGWVGVCCADSAMAAWMLRAILVENVMVRREGNVLFLPAGSSFRIEKEIKNVVTCVAKTAHYWQAHLQTRQPPNPL